MKKQTTTKPGKARSAPVASQACSLIDDRIAELDDWRGPTLAHLRALIKQALPAVVEEWKWDVPVWSQDGIVCTGETYKNAVKLTFAKGAAVGDPSKLFNSSLEGNTRRAIDFREGDMVDERAFRRLINAAAEVNASSRNGTRTKSAPARAVKKSKKT